MQQLRLVLVDAETGRPVAGRVAVHAGHGRYIPAVGQEKEFEHHLTGGHTRIAGKHRYTHVDRSAEFLVPSGRVRIEVLRGMEYAILTRELARVPRDPVMLRLKRWCSPAADGWYGGEGHAHYLPPDEARLQGDVEGLETLAITQQNDMTAYEKPEFFTGQPPDRPRPACRMRYVEEFRTDCMHVLLYDLRSFIGLGQRPAPGVGVEATRALLEAKAQGAVTSVAHFALNAQLGLLHALAHNAIDAIEILGTSVPTRPFISGGEHIPLGDVTTPLQMWYRLLNMGLRLPISAGTDRMSNEMTTGAHRTYVYHPGLRTFRQWARGIKAGRTFVTNGPQIRLTVDGQGPGSAIRVRKAGGVVKVEARAWSQFPVDRLELIQNGRVIRCVKADPVSHSAELACDVPVQQSGWIAARVLEDDAPYLNQDAGYYRPWNGLVTRTGRYFATARAESAFAHTSPVYLSVPGTGSHTPHDREFFEAWVAKTLAAVRAQSGRPAREIRDLAATYKRAAEGLRRRLEMAGVGSHQRGKQVQ